MVMDRALDLLLKTKELIGKQRKTDGILKTNKKSCI